MPLTLDTRKYPRVHGKPEAHRSAAVLLKDTSAEMDNSFHVSVLFFVCVCVCVCVGERGTACFLLVPMISPESLQSRVAEAECLQEAQCVLY